MDEEEATWVIALTLKSGVVVEQEITMEDFMSLKDELADFWTNDESVEKFVVFGQSMVKTSEVAAASFGGAVRRESTPG